ncbi:MAG: FIST N-terminal domain-containing protein [Patescibacteria group bacterium]
MVSIGIGTSSDADSFVAGVNAVNQALQELLAQSAMPAHIAFVFASSSFDHTAVLKGVTSVVGDMVKVVGASTAGEITKAGPTMRDSVAIMVLASDTLTCTTAIAPNLTADSTSAGSALATQLQAHNPELVMMFADGLKGNGSAVLRGVTSVLGQNFPVVGGSAGDNGKLVETHQFFGAEVQTDAVVGVGFSGNFKYSVGVNHGWNVVGAPQIITKSVGTTIHEINHKPAVSLYERYLGVQEISNLREVMLGEVALSYPLGIKDTHSEEFLLRAPFAVTEDGSIVCGGEVLEGSQVQLMVGSKEDAIAAASRAATSALENLGTTPKVAFIFSCHVRNTLFADKETAREEIQAIQAVIGKDVPIIGFYTYAEQAPINGTSYSINKCTPQLHNETVVITLLGE